MKLTKAKAASLTVFLLLYYIYMNGMRKIMIPQSAITIPVILAVVLFCTLCNSRFKMIVHGQLDAVQCASWIMIAVCISVHNTSLIEGLASGGMIQLYVMICFLLFAVVTSEWIGTWIKFSKFFVMLHGLATVVFYFSKPLYRTFVKSFFARDTARVLMKYYNKGYMCGLSSHFSSNGMILAIGILFFFETIRYKRKIGGERKDLYFDYGCILSLVYALILSSKRSPFLAAVLAVVITYIVSRKKNIIKRLMVVAGVSGGLCGVYMLLVSRIPGLSTLIDKSEMLLNSSAGILNGRLSLWRIALEMFLENPLFGKGYGSFEKISAAADTFTTSAHNYYLQIMAELGIFGLILYMVAFISSAVLTYKQFEKVRNCRNAEYLLMILSISLDIQVFVMIYSMTATSLMYYSIMIPYFLSCTVGRCVNVNKIE